MAREKLVIDLTPFSKPRRFKKPTKRAKVTLVTESIQHGTITPAGLYTPRGCVTKKSSKNPTAGPRPGQVDLVFMPRSSKAGAPPPGPALRLCTGKGKGVVVPTKGLYEAKALAESYQACVSGEKKRQKACQTCMQKPATARKSCLASVA